MVNGIWGLINRLYFYMVLKLTEISDTANSSVGVFVQMQRKVPYLCSSSGFWDILIIPFQNSEFRNGT